MRLKLMQLVQRGKFDGSNWWMFLAERRVFGAGVWMKNQIGMSCRLERKQIFPRKSSPKWKKQEKKSNRFAWISEKFHEPLETAIKVKRKLSYEREVKSDFIFDPSNKKAKMFSFHSEKISFQFMQDEKEKKVRKKKLLWISKRFLFAHFSFAW
jgi:hypothetical protein